MMKTALKLKQTESGPPLADVEALAVLRTLVKQRHESAEQFREGGHEGRAEKEEAEIRMVEANLPAAATEEEIEAVVTAAIAETGATTQRT